MVHPGPTAGKATAPGPFCHPRPASSSFTDKINIRVLDLFTVKPLDTKLILDSARVTKGRILTVEDHYYEGTGPVAGSWGRQGRSRGQSQAGRDRKFFRDVVHLFLPAAWL